jgi:hypothetical protein
MLDGRLPNTFRFENLKMVVGKYFSDFKILEFGLARYFQILNICKHTGRLGRHRETFAQVAHLGGDGGPHRLGIQRAERQSGTHLLGRPGSPISTNPPLPFLIGCRTHLAMHAANADANPRRAVSDWSHPRSEILISTCRRHQAPKDPPVVFLIRKETITIDRDADLMFLGPQHKLLATVMAALDSIPARQTAPGSISPTTVVPAEAASGTPAKAALANKTSQAAKAVQADEAADKADKAAKATKAAKSGTATRATKAAQAKAAAAAARAVAFAANETVLAALAAANTEGEAGEEETPRETDEHEKPESEKEESNSTTDDDEEGEEEEEGDAAGEALGEA